MSQQWRGAPRGHGKTRGAYRPRLSDDVHLPVLGGTSGYPCWCGGDLCWIDGDPPRQNWPGKAEGKPHPREGQVTATVSDFATAKAARVESRKAVEEAIKHEQMRKFNRQVRDAVMLLVNVHGIQYRMQNDGQHLMLYCNKPGTRPYKVSAAVKAPVTMKSLTVWVAEHFPAIDLAGETKRETAYGLHLFEPNSDDKCKVCGFEEDDGRAEHPLSRATVGQPAPIPDRVPETLDQQSREAEMPVPKPAPPKAATEPAPELEREPDAATGLAADQPPEVGHVPSDGGFRSRAVLTADGFTPYVYPTKGPSVCFMVKGEHLVCIECDYERTGSSFAGVHLHEAIHDGSRDKMLADGKETAARNRAIKAERTFESLSFLAAQAGLVVLTKEEAEEIGSLKAANREIARLKKQIEEQEAKTALAREALGL